MEKEIKRKENLVTKHNFSRINFQSIYYVIYYRKKLESLMRNLNHIWKKKVKMNDNITLHNIWYIIFIYHLAPLRDIIGN